MPMPESNTVNFNQTWSSARGQRSDFLLVRGKGFPLQNLGITDDGIQWGSDLIAGNPVPFAVRFFPFAG